MVQLFLAIKICLEMAVVPRGKNIVNDTTPVMCTIEGIAKKEHVVRDKLVVFYNLRLFASFTPVMHCHSIILLGLDNVIVNSPSVLYSLCVIS